MCIGDSITDDFNTPGTYRKFIYHGLKQKGYLIDMVGSRGSKEVLSYKDVDTGETFEYDNEHSGYSGYVIKSYSNRKGIYETLQSTKCLDIKPDIVTLQIGTNNIADKYPENEAIKDMKKLINYILNNIPNSSTLFVASILNINPNERNVYSKFNKYRYSDDKQTKLTDNETLIAVQKFVDSFNVGIKNIVESKGNFRLQFADVNSAITDINSQFRDGLHPNNKGHKAIGEFWFELLDEFFIFINSGKKKHILNNYLLNSHCNYLSYFFWIISVFLMLLI